MVLLLAILVCFFNSFIVLHSFARAYFTFYLCSVGAVHRSSIFVFACNKISFFRNTSSVGGERDDFLLLLLLTSHNSSILSPPCSFLVLFFIFNATYRSQMSNSSSSWLHGRSLRLQLGEHSWTYSSCVIWMVCRLFLWAVMLFECL